MLLDLTLVPFSYLALVAFGFGVIIGSFLNVYIYRFHTGKSLVGHSHCLSCGTTLRWYELFPLISWLCLQGRCRTCGCKIPSRYFLVELITGVLFASALTLSLSVPIILIWWFIFSLLVVITVYDLYHFIIPDELTLILTTATLALIGYQYYLLPFSLEEVMWRIMAALAGSGFLLFLWLISKGRWIGFGDVKLAFPLGLLVGTSYVFSFMVLSFWIGAGVSLLIMVYYHFSSGKSPLLSNAKPLTMKSAVPFAPFLIAGGLTAIIFYFDVLALFSFY